MLNFGEIKSHHNPSSEISNNLLQESSASNSISECFSPENNKLILKSIGGGIIKRKRIYDYTDA